MTGGPLFLGFNLLESVTSLKDVHRGRRFAGSCRAVRAAGERMPHAVRIGEAHGARGRIFRARSRTLRRSSTTAAANPAEGRIADANPIAWPFGGAPHSMRGFAFGICNSLTRFRRPLRGVQPGARGGRNRPRYEAWFALMLRLSRFAQGCAFPPRGLASAGGH